MATANDFKFSRSLDAIIDAFEAPSSQSAKKAYNALVAIWKSLHSASAVCWAWGTPTCRFLAENLDLRAGKEVLPSAHMEHLNRAMYSGIEAYQLVRLSAVYGAIACQFGPEASSASFLIAQVIADQFAGCRRVITAKASQDPHQRAVEMLTLV